MRAKHRKGQSSIKIGAEDSMRESMLFNERIDVIHEDPEELLGNNKKQRSSSKKMKQPLNNNEESDGGEYSWDPDFD